MSSIAIEFDNVGKQYRLGRVGTGTLSHDLNRWWTMNVLGKEDPYLRIGETNDRSKKGNSEYVWALKDISFKVEQGDVVGIIGKNGAGKSTLLKLLSRITSPSTGSIRYNGRIASLLEVGTGFHPEMTGRENIYMNGSIMGMTKAEITRKLDEIVDFAGVERYLDTPVKRYSSGMTVRLGFAVAAFLEPEILVVDEVLTVGDAEFQKKAIGKMNDVAHSEGRTVLFVSHNMAAVKNLCTRGVVLQNGTLAYDGTTEEAVNYYLKKSNIASQNTLGYVQILEAKSKTIQVSTLKINGFETGEIPIPFGQCYLDIEIVGNLETETKMDLQIQFANIDDVVLATFAEAKYMAKSEKYPKGEFNIHKRIKFPKYIASGVYKINILLYEPRVQDLIGAQACCLMHVEGNYEAYGRPLYLSTEGFMGLEEYHESHGMSIDMESE